MESENKFPRMPLMFYRLRARFAWIWRLGLIRRGTAFRWEVDCAVYPDKKQRTK